MQRSTREVEIKLPFDSATRARERIEVLGATPCEPRRFEDNVVLDRDDGSLKRGDMVLRVRTVGDRTVLTLKTPVEGRHTHKVRNEYETVVDDASAILQLLRGLGFAPRWRYQKYRTVFALGDLEICLDETPLGCYVELEGPPDQIDHAARRLGFTPDRYVRLSYGELCEREAARRGEPFADLLLESSAERAP